MKRKASEIAGAERHLFKLACGAFNESKMPGARVQQPELVAVDSRRMRHGKAGRDDLIRLHVNHAAAVMSPITPAIRDVRLAHGRDILRLPVLQYESVPVATIFSGQPAEEWRFPQWYETVRVAELRETAEQCIDEDDATAGFNGNVMDIQIARRLAQLRNIHSVIAGCNLSQRQNILKSPQLIQRRHPQRLPVSLQAEASIERAFKNRQP